MHSRKYCGAVAPPIGFFLFLWLLSSGCSKEELMEKVEQVKEATVEKVEQVEQLQAILPKNGEFKMMLDAPTDVSLGIAELVTIGDGRPNILQIRSYSNNQQETYPAIFFHAAAPVHSLDQLVGKSVFGKLYVQTAANGPVWFCEDNAPVTVTISAIEETELVGSFSSGSLQRTDGKTANVTGSFRAVIQQADAPRAAMTFDAQGARR